MMQSHAKSVAYIGIFSCFGIICGYIEMLIPFSIGIPGIKLGLSNIVSMIALYLFGGTVAFFVTIIRILVSQLLFGTIYSFCYSICGGLIALLGMRLLYKRESVSCIGTSVAGAFLHNVGQLFTALFFLREIRILYYFIILTIAALFCGMITGVLSLLILRRIGYDRLLKRGSCRNI